MTRAPWVSCVVTSHQMTHWHRFWAGLPVGLRQTDAASLDWLAGVFFIVSEQWTWEEQVAREEAEKQRLTVTLGLDSQ